MHENHKGFTIVELILIGIVAGVIALVGWFAWGALHKVDSGNAGQTKKLNDTLHRNGLIRITLIDESTGNLIEQRSFELISNNGMQCITEPCPTDEMHYKVVSDKAGIIAIPPRYFQDMNWIEGDGYVPERLVLRDDASDYVLKLTPRHD